MQSKDNITLLPVSVSLFPSLLAELLGEPRGQAFSANHRQNE